MIDLTSFSNDPATVQISEFIRGGRWRKARDAAKELCKKDRARYLPLLVAANVGLAQELLGKGLVKEAITVVEYLKTIAPAEVVEKLQVECAKPAVKTAAPPSGSHSSGTDWWEAALRVEKILSEGGNPSPADLAAVDALVADRFVPVIVDGEGERAKLLNRELASVRQACDATGEGNWDAAREFLRELPRQSIFRHWRMFLRGTGCFYREEFETARQCFATLPPQGALAMAARALDPTLVPTGAVAPPGARVPFLLAATGQPSAWASVILSANAEIKAGKRFKAFKLLEAGMKGKFPTERPGLPAALTQGLLLDSKSLDGKNVDDLMEIAKYCFANYHGKQKAANEALLSIFRPMSVICFDESPANENYQSWLTNIEMFNIIEGPNPMRDSIVLEWVGEQLAKPSSQRAGLFDLREDVLTSKKLARKAFERAVELDPTNEQAWLALLELTNRMKLTADYHHLLESLVKKFPKNKFLLSCHGEMLFAKGKLEAALQSMQAALALDPLDPDTRNRLVLCLMTQTRQLLGEKKPAVAQWEAMEPLLDNNPYPDKLMLSRWMMRIRRALLDSVAAAAKEARQQAAELAPSPIENLFAERLLGCAYGLRLRNNWTKEWKDLCKKQAWSWKIFSKWIILHGFISQIFGWSAEASKKIETLLIQVLTSLLAPSSLKQPDDLLGFFDAYDSMTENQTHFSLGAYEKILRQIHYTLDVVADPRKKKPDPRLRMATMLAREYTDYYSYWDLKRFEKDIDAIQSDAEKQGMDDVLNRIKAMLTRYINGPPDHRHDDDDDDDDYYGDEEDWDEEEYDDEFEDPGFEVEIIPSSTMEPPAPPPPPPPAKKKASKAKKKPAKSDSAAENPELF